jgi:hypothetical protein
MQVHPWLSVLEVLPAARRSMLVRLKSIEEMLSSDDPPRWVVLLDRMGLWHHCRIRVVIYEYATVEYEPAFDQPSITWMLEDVDYGYLTTLLRGVTPETFRSANTAILDGDLCALTVVHGNPQWLAYAEVNLSGLRESEGTAVARLATRLTQIADSTANTE